MANILIIDDEKAICDEFGEILRDDGYEVSVANNGQDGLDLVAKNKFDLIFLDILMPRMDGMEVLKRLKQETETPVIIMSGYIPPGQGRKILAAGAEAVYRKPLEIKHVLETIPKILSGETPG